MIEGRWHEAPRRRSPPPPPSLPHSAGESSTMRDEDRPQEHRWRSRR
jgi:hypothetical protein